MLPEPGSKEWEDMAEFIRADLISDMMLTKLVMTVREQFKEQGKDFDEEFKKWKESKGDKLVEEKKWKDHLDVECDHYFEREGE